MLAGGDPSLHPDLLTLVRAAHSLGMWTEIQTNAQRLNATAMQALVEADEVGLSLDSHTPETHDWLRRGKGNQTRVIALMDEMDRLDKRVTVRSVVNRANHRALASLGDVLAGHSSVRRWVLLELTPVGDAIDSWDELSISSEDFQTVATECVAAYPTLASPVSLEDKAGAYALIRSDGCLYGTDSEMIGHYFPVIGSLLTDHLDDLANAMRFSSTKHARRYHESGGATT